VELKLVVDPIAQPVRSKAVPLTEAEQFEPGTPVVVVGTVVVVVVTVGPGDGPRAATLTGTFENSCPVEAPMVPSPSSPSSLRPQH